MSQQIYFQLHLLCLTEYIRLKDTQRQRAKARAKGKDEGKKQGNGKGERKGQTKGQSQRAKAKAKADRWQRQRANIKTSEVQPCEKSFLKQNERTSQ